MAAETTIKLIDDLDGGIAHETVTFGLDGRTYEIDLSTKHAKKFRTDLATFVDRGSPIRTQTARPARTARSRAVRTGTGRGGGGRRTARVTAGEKNVNQAIRSGPSVWVTTLPRGGASGRPSWTSTTERRALREKSGHGGMGTWGPRGTWDRCSLRQSGVPALLAGPPNICANCARGVDRERLVEYGRGMGGDHRIGPW